MSFSFVYHAYAFSIRLRQKSLIPLNQSQGPLAFSPHFSAYLAEYQAHLLDDLIWNNEKLVDLIQEVKPIPQENLALLLGVIGIMCESLALIQHKCHCR